MLIKSKKEKKQRNNSGRKRELALNRVLVLGVNQCYQICEMVNA